MLRPFFRSVSDILISDSSIGKKKPRHFRKSSRMEVAQFVCRHCEFIKLYIFYYSIFKNPIIFFLNIHKQSFNQQFQEIVEQKSFTLLIAKCVYLQCKSTTHHVGRENFCLKSIVKIIFCQLSPILEVLNTTQRMGKLVEFIFRHLDIYST